MERKYLYIFLLVSGCHCDVFAPYVTTKLGQIKGYSKTSHGGKTFSAFQGIPYAKAPIGERRFEVAEPIEPWIGIWNATVPTTCAQTAMLDPDKIIGDEDCLHLNVYVPREIPDPETNLDVIVGIHGGAYMYGSGHWFSDPQFIMDRDIIFVTINYRLGILGFLSTEDEVVPGNNGLKDQNIALKWVQNNIRDFGGNPNSVTIIGCSAGGSSVHFHYFSELSKGLFHRGVSLSGAALNAFSQQKAALQKAKHLAHAVGCSTASSSTRIMVNCLKQRPFQQLLNQLNIFFGYKTIPFAPFAPVIEKAGSSPFISKNPYNLLKEGKVLDVPWITSNTAHEGLVATFAMRNDLEAINSKWEDWAPFLLDFNYTLPQELWKSTSKKIKEFYLGKDRDISPLTFFQLTQMFTDRILTVDAETTVRLQAKVTNSPIYYYHFNYLGDDNKEKVVPHAVEGKYMFVGAKPLTTNELKMKDFFLDMLVSYAKIGVPAVGSTIWEPTSYDKLTYLNVSGYEPEDVKLVTVDELTPRSFWKSLGFRENENLVVVKDEL